MRHKSLAEERPELEAQWAPNNKLSPDQVSCGSHLKVWWICSEGHKWQATVAIDVCESENEASVKEYVCELNGLTYICLSPKLSEEDVITRIQKAFYDAHIYFNTSLVSDLEIIKQRYAHWKNNS